MRQVTRMAVLAAWAAAGLAAQPVAPAKAGLVSFTVGKVYLDNEAIAATRTRFPDMRQAAVLRTEGGRAEVLLGPCAVLRLDEDSSFRLADASLVAPRVELLAGSAVVDIAGIHKGSVVTLGLEGRSVEMARIGLYRFDESPALLKVFEGRAAVERRRGRQEVPGGRMLALDSAAPEKFDIRGGDGLDLWSHERSLVLARARGRRQMSMMDLAAAAGTAMGDASMAGRGSGVDPAIIGPRSMGSDPATLRQPRFDTSCKP